MPGVRPTGRSIAWRCECCAPANDAQRGGAVIWEAVTDGTETLRYRAGEDAVALLDNRKALDDATFFGGIKARMGVS